LAQYDKTTADQVTATGCELVEKAQENLINVSNIAPDVSELIREMLQPSVDEMCQKMDQEIFDKLKELEANKSQGE